MNALKERSQARLPAKTSPQQTSSLVPWQGQFDSKRARPRLNLNLPPERRGAAMPYIHDFDTDAILRTLESIGQKHPEGSPERDAIELAQIALIYPRHVRKEDDFRKFYRDCFDSSFKLVVSHEFMTQEDADAWITSGKAQDAERVRIAGRGFMVVELSGRFVLMRAPLEGEEAQTDESGKELK